MSQEIRHLRANYQSEIIQNCQGGNGFFGSLDIAIESSINEKELDIHLVWDHIFENAKKDAP